MLLSLSGTCRLLTGRSSLGDGRATTNSLHSLSPSSEGRCTPLDATGQLLATSPARRGCYWSASSDIVKRSVASQLKLNSTYRSGALNELVQPSLLLHKLHVLMIDPSKVCCKSGIPSHRRFCFNVFPQLVAVSPLIFVYIFLFAPGEKSFRLLLHIYRTFIASQR